MHRRKTLKKTIISSAPVQTFIRGSKHLVVPGFGNFSLFEIWKPFVDQLKNSNLFERAAAISFNVFMAIPPTLIFVFTLIPYLPISDRFINELFELIRDIIPGEKNNTVIIGFLNDFLERPRNELLSFGLLFAILFSSNAMMGILRSFDKNYIGFTKPSGLKKRRLALKLTLVFFSLIFLCILFLIAQGAVLEWLGMKNSWLRSLIHNVRWVIILLLLFYSISFIYRFGPSVVVRWPFITPGSVFATTLMILVSLLVSYWVNNFGNYNKLYGSISAIFILMVFIYINAMAIIIGFELNVTIATLKSENLLKN
jgi:membrane protein